MFQELQIKIKELNNKTNLTRLINGDDYWVSQVFDSIWPYKTFPNINFDNKKFKWDRLEDLLSNAAKQTNLDLEKLLDEVINLLFSPNGGFLRNEIVEGLTNQIDLLSLKILKSLNNYLPQSIKLNTVNENNNLRDLIIYVEPLRNFLEILQKVPGYSIDIFLKRVPRLINEPYAKEMSIEIAKKVTEKGMVRLVKIAAGANI